MSGDHDVAGLTGDLVAWAQDLLPAATVVAGPPNPAGGTAAENPAQPDRRARTDQPAKLDQVLIRLASIEGASGPRTRDSVSHRIKLEYRFELSFADAAGAHQAMADLVFALLEREDLAQGHEMVRGSDGAISAFFAVDRHRDLPRAKPVRETVFNLQPQAQIAGRVVSGDKVPIGRARVHVGGTDRLILTDPNGAFAFTAPLGTAVRAQVSAKGKVADAILRPGRPNVITLEMEP